MNYIEGNVDVYEETLTLEDLRAWRAMPRQKLILPPVEEEEVVAIKVGWDLSKSIFAKVKQDTPKLMDSCFEYDWECSRLEKICEHFSKEQRDKIHTFLKHNYRIIKDSYKFFSGLSPAGGVCSIGTNLFNYICFNCNGMVDQKSLKLSDVGLDFITIKATGSHLRTRQNPERQLIRFQFMEIWVRLAMSKYIKSKQTLL